MQDKTNPRIIWVGIGIICTAFVGITFTATTIHCLVESHAISLRIPIVAVGGGMDNSISLWG